MTPLAPATLGTALLLGAALVASQGGQTALQPGPDTPVPLAVDPEDAREEVRHALEGAAAFLPVGFALDALAGVPVAVHRREGAQVAQVVEQEGAPVLLLSERSYFASGRMIDLGDAAVDTVAHLFEALYTLWARRFGLADPARRAELEAIAGPLYVDLPAERRVEALVDAQAQYAGHLASIAAAVERSARRTGARFCSRLDGPLFGLWARTGGAVEYLGTVHQEAPGGGAWRSSKVDLPPAQRDAVRAGPLEGRWSGDPRRDFAPRYCP